MQPAAASHLSLFLCFLRLAAIFAATPAMAAEAGYLTAANSGCLGCHAVDFEHAGPSFQQIATRYARDDKAMAELMRSVREGSSGKWGTAPMPPAAPPTEAALRQILQWVLQQ